MKSRLRKFLIFMSAFILFASQLMTIALARPAVTPPSELVSSGQNGYVETKTTITPTYDPDVYEVKQTLRGKINKNTIAVAIVLDNSGSMGNEASMLQTGVDLHPVYDANLLPLEYLALSGYQNFFPSSASYTDSNNNVHSGTGNNLNWIGGGYRWEWAIWGAKQATKVFLDETYSSSSVNRISSKSNAKNTAVAYVGFTGSATPSFSEGFHSSNNSTMNSSMVSSYNFAGDYDGNTQGALGFLDSKLTQRSNDSSNTETGLTAAYNYLKAIDADRKFVLLLSDGEPTAGSQESLFQVAAALKAPRGGMRIAGMEPLGAEIYAINLGSEYDHGTKSDNNVLSSRWLSNNWIYNGIYGSGSTSFGAEQTMIGLASVMRSSYFNNAAFFSAYGLQTNAKAIQDDLIVSETEKHYKYISQSSNNPKPADATAKAFQDFAKEIVQQANGIQVTSVINSDIFSLVRYSGNSAVVLSSSDNSGSASPGEVTISGNTLIWDIDKLDANETLTMTYYVKMDRSGLIDNDLYPVLDDTYITFSANGLSYCVNYAIPAITSSGSTVVEDNDNDADDDNSGDEKPTETADPRDDEYTPSSRPHMSPDFSFAIYEDENNSGVKPGATPPPAVVAAFTNTPAPTTFLPNTPAAATSSPDPNEIPTDDPIADFPADLNSIPADGMTDSTNDLNMPVTGELLLLPLGIIALIAVLAIKNQRNKYSERRR